MTQTQAPAFYARVGETFSIAATLKGANDVAADLTNATSVKMSLWPLGSSTPVYDKVTCTFAPDLTGKAAFKSPAVIAFAPDDYNIEFQATFVGGQVKKFPDDDSIVLVRISPTAP